MVEQMIADVDVLAAIVPEGETESLAGAAQSGRNQGVVVAALQAVLPLLNQSEATEAVKTDAQQLFIGLEGEAEGLLQPGQGPGFPRGQLVEQIGDRELHRRGLERVGGTKAPETITGSGTAAPAAAERAARGSRVTPFVPSGFVRTTGSRSSAMSSTVSRG